MTSSSGPPRFAEQLLRRALPPGSVADSIAGDLREEHARRERRSSLRSAHAWYLRHAMGLAVRGLVDRIRSSGPLTTTSHAGTRAGDPMAASMLRSLRHGARGLVRAPQFTVAVTITLALAIGTNAAIFSVVQGVLLKPLPFAAEDRLVVLQHSAPGLGYDEFGMSPGLFWRYAETDAFESTGFHVTEAVNVTGADMPPGRVVAARVSRGVLPTLGVAPLLGRVFGEDEATPDGPAVVVLSHGFWQDRYGSDAGVLGGTLEIDGAPHTIIGVMPPSVRFPDADTRMWLPLNIDPANAGAGEFSYSAIARLRPGVDAAGAKLRTDGVVAQLREGLDGDAGNFAAFIDAGRLTTLVTPLREQVVGDVSRALWILLGTVGFVFLIACANAANLFLVRAESRHREMAVRAALGGSRMGLIGHYAAEALLVAVAAGALGLAIAWAGTRALVALAPPGIPRLHDVAIDPVVLAFTLGATLLSALLLGMLPAVRLSAPALLSTLSRASRGGSAGRESHRARHALVVAQTALALMLLIGSGLMVRSFQNLRAIDPGFEPAETSTFRVALPAGSYDGVADVERFHSELVARLGALPGIAHVGAVTHPPLSDCCAGTAYEVDGLPVQPGEMPPMLGYSAVAGDWFAAMGVPIRAGRAFDSSDRDEGRHSVIVSEVVAGRFWPGGDAVGRRMRPVDDSNWYTIVGVAGDVRGRGLQEEPYPMVYYPVTDHATGISAPYFRSVMYVLRTPRRDDVASIARAEVWALDPQLPVTATGSYEKLVAASMVRISFTMMALVAAALIALFLGTVGLYSVISYIVAQRTNEIGIRLALGAQPAAVRRMVVVQGGRMVLLGLVVGVAGALALTRFMQGVLYGTAPSDPLTFMAVSAILGCIAILALYVPARRASRIDPAGALRDG